MRKVQDLLPNQCKARDGPAGYCFKTLNKMQNEKLRAPKQIDYCLDE